MRKLSWIGLYSAAFMFPQILSVEYSLHFLNVETLLNSPVYNHIRFILSGILKSGRLSDPGPFHDSIFADTSQIKQNQIQVPFW